ncbi:AcrR family transcriptional regulator [Paenarthrobacter nicotinovorans]|uniref:TetR/AcrR family transcriptional regulator n=1 Tax=Micrococcaceae TaxID=1268 RepID=UPI0008764D34|nr:MULTISPECIES: TetR/AcrR family transcriptional regulator [Micrococcaceae]MDR6438727.1 AcrR family transcriptional regulator [Paenarthrobacter nicotinovorans]SCZ56460.1 transcriptional regulator, TetR family [Arthrobacter sp. UNCCL28]
MVATAERGTAQAIREEAAKLFFERGYDATSLRQVASAVGLMVGSLYNHIDSKEHLLLQIMGGIIDDLLDSARKAVMIDGDEIDKLEAALAAHLTFHAERAQEVFIGNAELRSLSEGARQVVIEKRHEYELFLQELVEAAGRAGLADVIDAKIHVYSFVAQATHIASWFKPGGRMNLDEIVAIYTKLALRELSVPDADARVDNRSRLAG